MAISSKQTHLYFRRNDSTGVLELVTYSGEDIPGTVVGTVEHVDCIMQVGNGWMAHHGQVPEATVTVAFDKINRFGRSEQHYEPGEKIRFEPFNNCGAVSYHRGFGVYVGRSRNRILPEGTEVTCTKCLKKAESRKK